MMAGVKQRVRSLLERTIPGYRYVLKRREGATGPTGKPNAPWHNAVLKTFEERDEAAEQVKRLGLPIVNDRPKNWDALAALDCMLASTSRNARILDAGAQTYSRILPWLFLYGYRNLEGINIVFKGRKKVGPIIYRYGDVTATDYPDETFDAIVCLSVVEHGVDLNAYFKEASRILKPKGVLVTSTDYWHDPIDTHGKKQYGVPVHIFTRAELELAIRTAERYGLALTSPLDLVCNEKVVYWRNVDLNYTFVVFTLQKLSAH
jgi:SAM-dependent methyltransferase